MNNSNRFSAWVALSSVLALLSLAACGDDSADGTGSSGSGGGDGKSCGTVDDPVLFKLADVTPATGSTVDGAAVVHSFRVVDAPAAVNELAFQTAATHTSGTPTPAQLVFTVQQDGKDLVYTASAVAWETTGHVELSIPVVYEGQGCVYAFPSPLFAYDVDASGEGGGGGGSTGSTGAGGDDAGAGGAGGGAP